MNDYTNIRNIEEGPPYFLPVHPKLLEKGFKMDNEIKNLVFPKVASVDDGFNSQMCVFVQDKQLKSVLQYIDHHDLNTILPFTEVIDANEKKVIQQHLETVSNRVFISNYLNVFTSKDDKLPFVVSVGIKNSLNQMLVNFSCFTRYENFEQVKTLFNTTLKALTTKPKDNSVSIGVDWMYTTKDGNFSYQTITESIFETIHDEAYPFIPNLTEFVTNYLNSPASVLVLTGLQGTGKTRLIRHIARLASTSANPKRNSQYQSMAQAYRYSTPYNPFGSDMSYPDDGGDDQSDDGASNLQTKIRIAYTSDFDVLQNEKFYITIRGGNYDFIILEDIDLKLVPREEGNELMHKFLAMSDGFLSNNCRIVFTTNLDIKELDQALVRPGRCYAAIETRELDCTEAKVLAAKLTDKTVEFKHGCKYTLAEVYNMVYKIMSGQPQKEAPKMGFCKR